MKKNSAERKGTILLIEDDISTRESLMTKLDKAGFKTDFAENGLEGLEKLRKDGSFLGILLDLRMPRGDGFDFLKEKQQDASISDIPVIVLSNLSQPEFVEKAVALGANGYLVKANHSLEDILKEIENCFKDKKCLIDKN